MHNFALIGAAGYIAPRHIKAIADSELLLSMTKDKAQEIIRKAKEEREEHQLEYQKKQQVKSCAIYKGT